MHKFFNEKQQKFIKIKIWVLILNLKLCKFNSKLLPSQENKKWKKVFTFSTNCNSYKVPPTLLDNVFICRRGVENYLWSQMAVREDGKKLSNNCSSHTLFTCAESVGWWDFNYFKVISDRFFGLLAHVSLPNSLATLRWVESLNGLIIPLKWELSGH